jgi:hypothetical protein
MSIEQGGTGQGEIPKVPEAQNPTYPDQATREARERRNAKAREYNQRNPEPQREASRKWREEHPERVSEHIRKWRQGYYQKNREKAREYYLAHRDEILKQKKER